MKAKRLSVILVVMGLLLGAVGAAAQQDPTGKKCAIDGHPVKDKRFAVVVERKKSVKYFDDIGCAVLWRASKCMPTQVKCDAVTYAFDYYTGKPVHVRAAYYVYRSSVKTPQGYGIVALKDEESAKRFLKEFGGDGKIYDYEGIQSLVELK